MTDIYVDREEGDDSNSGADPEQAVMTVEQAVQLASSSDSIVIQR